MSQKIHSYRIQSKSDYFVHLIALPKRQNNSIDKNDPMVAYNWLQSAYYKEKIVSFWSFLQ